MSDPTELVDALAEAEDAFEHAHGRPEFEPGVDAASDTPPGKVRIQKGCRLLLAANTLESDGDHFTSVLEHAFAAIERTLEGYLVAIAGDDPATFHDHTTVYDRAKRQAPVTTRTLDSIQALYAARRTEHYYGTSVTTRRQADTMLEVAKILHRHLVGFDPDLRRYCRCDRG